MNKLTNLLMALILLSTLSCLKKDSGDSDSGDTNPLQGTWVAACSSYKSEIEIGTSSIVFTNNGWTDGSCTTQTQKEIITGTYTYSASNIDVTVTKHEITIFNSGDITTANGATYCGFNNWVSGVTKDVTGVNCDVSSHTDDSVNPYSNGDSEQFSYTLSSGVLNTNGGNDYSKQ